ncbi:cupin domain-containing protein [Chamaesiphon sp. OTE_8_metabat_110]|uniref:(R)-mandelonitrile lyase n=1 Tax=Chamaesiphon sp. OTE_8_metabat_110 TaxID=2964696 RepID=UPI002869F540|nr:cupin domain-containing protein [Chamaesiphon sp. OTE_8_metabat_110]
MKRITIGLMLCAALFSAACSNQQTANPEQTKMEKAEDKTEHTIFPKGEKASAKTFTGTVYVQILAPKNETNNFSIASVTFEQGARANWHNHPAGQTILVTEGKGLYQEKGKPIKTINKGDVILCNPDIEHWHGASPESRMTHVVITNYKGDSQVNWLKPVTDEEYQANAK